MQGIFRVLRNVILYAVAVMALVTPKAAAAMRRKNAPNALWARSTPTRRKCGYAAWRFLMKARKANAVGLVVQIDATHLLQLGADLHLPGE
jgi:hypothetical protein